MAVPTSLRWIVTGQQRPPIEHALWVGEDVKEAVQTRLKCAVGEIPKEFCDHTRDGGLPRGDPHPFYLPEDADDDGLIDHLMLHVPQGLHADWRGALNTLELAVPPDRHLPPFGLRADWLGNIEPTDPPGRLLGLSRVWCSATSYVPDIHLRLRRNREEEKERLTKALVDDLRKRGFVEPDETAVVEAHGEGKYLCKYSRDETVTVEWLDVLENGLRPGDYKNRRRSGKKPIARSHHPGSGFRIVFSKEKRGPLAIGFACHLGLGLFRHEGSLLSATSRGGRSSR